MEVTMKKTISAILLIAVMMIMGSPASAAQNVLNTSHLKSYQEDLVALAYMDLDQVDIETKAKIIEAREEIIFSQDWVVDDIDGYVVDEFGNILEEVPHFSEVFPADWEVPSFTIEQPLDTARDLYLEEDGVVSFYNNWLTLSEPSTSANTKPFCYASASNRDWDLTSLATFGEIIDGGKPTFNVGYANADTGASLGVKTNIANRDGFVITNFNSAMDVAVRASTFDRPSEHWWVQVFGGFRYN